jgi:N-acetylglucosamine-6-phosphate deacetylase
VTSVISAPGLVVDGALTGPGAVVVAEGRIVDVLDQVPGPGPDHLALRDGLLSAGLVDLQVNGFAGHDLVEADVEGWRAVSCALAGHGVTAFVGTFITAGLSDLVAGLGRAHVARSERPPGGARLLGVHLEGPWLSPLRKGAHDDSLMVDPEPDAVGRLLAAGDLAIVTLAPERHGALAAVRQLSARGVLVSLGHTDSTAETATAAVDAGARMVTHLFNAMRPLHHRDPGPAGVALTDPRLAVGLICDLHHVDSTVCRLVVQAAAGRVVLVSDAIAAAGMPPGRYQLGGQAVEVSEPGALPRRPDGTVAGSSLTLDLAVRNAVACGVDPAAALTAATAAPAAALRRTDVGVLAPGAHADLVWWSDDLQVRRTWIAGEPL